MIKYNVPVIYSVSGTVEVEANDREDLLRKLKTRLFVNDMPLPDHPEYVDDSYEPETEWEFIAPYNVEAPKKEVTFDKEKYYYLIEFNITIGEYQERITRIFESYCKTKEAQHDYLMDYYSNSEFEDGIYVVDDWEAAIKPLKIKELSEKQYKTLKEFGF